MSPVCRCVTTWPSSSKEPLSGHIETLHVFFVVIKSFSWRWRGSAWLQLEQVGSGAVGFSVGIYICVASLSLSASLPCCWGNTALAVFLELLCQLHFTGWQGSASRWECSFLSTVRNLFPILRPLNVTSTVFNKYTENVWSCLWRPCSLIALWEMMYHALQVCCCCFCYKQTLWVRAAYVRDKPFGFFNWCVLSSFIIKLSILSYLNFVSSVLGLLQESNCFLLTAE